MGDGGSRCLKPASYEITGTTDLDKRGYHTMISVWLTVFLLAFHVTGYAGESITFRVSDAMPSNTPLGRVAGEWAASIEKQSRGDVDVIIYPGSQLFSPEQQINAVARKYVNVAFVHFDYWGWTLPEISVLSRPYHFPDRDSLLAFSHSRLCLYLEDKIQEKGMKVLAWLVMGTQIGISTKDQPVIKPEDFTHMKIRGAGPLVNSMLRSVGASPVTLGGAEIYQALQTGMIDGSFTTPYSTYMRRFYDVTNWVTVTPLFPSYIMIIVNLEWWQSLPDDYRSIITQVSSEAEQQAMVATDEIEAELPDQLRGKGMSVYFPDAREIEVLKLLMEPAWVETFLELTGEKGSEVLEYSVKR